MKTAWLILGLLLASGCANRIFYQPDRFLRPGPETRGLRVEEVVLEASDGVRLAAWWLPAEPPVRGTVVHFHGNAQNMTTHVRFAEWLPAEGYHLLVFDYRGYGRSQGVPSRRGLVKDGVAALQWAAAREENPGETLFIWGQSLGGTVALQAFLQAEVPVAALLIDSTFTSHTRIAGEMMRRFPWFLQPLRLFRPLLVTPGLDAIQALPQPEGLPIAFLHGAADPVIPPSHSERLFEAAGEPRHVWIIPGAGHCDAVLRFPELTRGLILGFFRSSETVPERFPNFGNAEKDP